MAQPHPRLSADQTRAKLVEAAMSRLREAPPAEVSVREIAAAAGVNHGMVHRYFGSKDGLVLAVLREVFRQTGEAIGPNMGEDREEALARGLAVLLRERWIAEVLAHVLMSRRGTEGLPRFTMMPLVRQWLGGIEPGREVQVGAVVAVGEAATLGWMLFEPLVVRGTTLDALGPEERLRALARVLAGPLGEEILAANQRPPSPVQQM